MLFMTIPHRFFFAFLLLFAQYLPAQEDTSERIIDDNIRAVQINPQSPNVVVALKGGAINLSFDYVTDELKDSRTLRLKRFAMAGGGLAAMCVLLLAVEIFQRSTVS